MNNCGRNLSFRLTGLTRGVGLLLLMLAFAASSFAQDTSSSNAPSADQIEKLIASLGSDSFTERESAENQLLAFGQASIEQVAQARASTDSEIRFRAQRLFKLLKKAAFKEQLRTFVESPDANVTPLRGWNEFSAIVGQDLSLIHI